MVPTLRAVSSLGDVLHCIEADVDDKPYTVVMTLMMTLCSSKEHNYEESSTRMSCQNKDFHAQLRRPDAAATSF